MGMTKKYSYVRGEVVYESGFSLYSTDELRYQTSFDWIVPVAQEIIYKYPEISSDFDIKYKQNPYDRRHIYDCCIGFLEELKNL